MAKKNTMGDFMDSLSKDGECNAAAIDSFSTSVFGRPLKAKEFPYDFSKQGIETSIDKLSIFGDSLMMMNLMLRDKEGVALTDTCQVVFMKDKQEGGVQVSINTVRKNQDYEGPIKIGNLLDHAHKTFLEDRHAEGINGSLSLTADSQKEGYGGAYVWATKGYAFADNKERDLLRNMFQSFADAHGAKLTKADMEHFTAPCHFAAFDSGKPIIIHKEPACSLTKAQRKSGCLDEAKKTPLTEAERSSGKTCRHSVPIGKAFLLDDQEWHAKWKPHDKTNKEADTYARIYRNPQTREKAFFVLSPEYKQVVTRVKKETLVREQQAFARARFQRVDKGTSRPVREKLLLQKKNEHFQK